MPSANEIGRLVVTIGADLTDFNKQMKALQMGMKQALGKDALNLSKDLEMGLMAAAAAAAAFAGTSVMMAANLDETRIAFTNLLGSAEKANQFIGALEEIEKRSPFKFEQLDQASRKLLAVGFSAEQIIPIFNTINDTVSGLKLGDSGLGDLSSVFEKIQMAGSISNRELRTLKTEGIDAGAMIAEKMGVSIPTALNLIKAGAVDSKTAITALVDGMNEKFGGMAGKLGTELPHEFKRMGDDVADIMRTEGEKIENSFGIKKFVDDIRVDFDKFAEALKTNGIGDSLDKVFGSKTMDMVKIAAITIGGALLGAAVPGLIAFTVAAYAALVPLTPWILAGIGIAALAYLIASNWGHLMTWFQEAWINDGYTAVHFLHQIETGFLSLAQIILDNAGKLFGWVPGIGDAIKGVQGKITELKGNLQAADDVDFKKAQAALDKVKQKAQAAADAAKGVTPGGSTPNNPNALDSLKTKATLDYLIYEQQLTAKIKDAENNYDLTTFKQLLNDKDAAFMDSLAARKEAMSLYEAMQLAANKTLAEAGLDAQKSLYDNLSNSMISVIDGTTNVVTALENMGKQIANIFLKYGLDKIIGSIMAPGVSAGAPLTPDPASIPMHGAGGHFDTPHIGIVGDVPETIIPDTDWKKYTASGDTKVTTNMINNTGTPMKQTSTSTRQGKETIVNIVLEAVALNQGGLRTALKGVTG
jgi:hypothetical protein